MDKHTFYNELLTTFPHIPTKLQNIALQQLSCFLTTETSDLFLLKGFAGTGKTSITRCLVENLPHIGQKAVLLAPTGRASKVMTGYANHLAFTIHKHIYYSKISSRNGFSFSLKPNKHKNTLFIVDEASMISDSNYESTALGGNSLLDDLVQYVYGGERCSLLLMGDTAQLTPVGSSESPALEQQHLSFQYSKNILQIELDEVVRQAQNSGILFNATKIRASLFQKFDYSFKFKLLPFNDVVRLVEGSEIQEAIQDAYAKHGYEQTTIIVRSNKRAVLYNLQIRNVILGNEHELSPGDLVMVVKNNYYWLKNSAEVSFIANGDTLEVLQIYRFKELYGLRFAEVKVRLVDYPNQTPFETILLLDTLTSETASLSQDENQRFFNEVMLDYQDETSNYRKYEKTKNNVYFNALQVKFSYAVTCHKSQGGQWETVFIEKPYLADGANENYLRWLYTALTRATQKVYLIGFKEDDFYVDDEL